MISRDEFIKRLGAYSMDWKAGLGEVSSPVSPNTLRSMCCEEVRATHRGRRRGREKERWGGKRGREQTEIVGEERGMGREKCGHLPAIPVPSLIPRGHQSWRRWCKAEGLAKTANM